MPHPADNTAEAAIRRRIAQQGRVTFAGFMDAALYHPAGGYYTSA
ncbi:MAG: class I SAM-dependent methyltransferase, partial [SAR202 cluster bacterium]|nr:class I SAM-dependent methyltransferase [SAR202 cluster bacterium]